MYDGGATYQFSFKRSIAPGKGLMGDIDWRRLRNLPSVRVVINKGMITWAQLINSSGALQSPSLINPPRKFALL